MSGDFSPISGRGHQRFYNDHLSLSEQASPSKKSIVERNPTDAIKLMVALLSLENTMLRADLRNTKLKAGFQSIQIADFAQGGGEYGAENFQKLGRELQFYQNKAMALEIELSKRKKADPPAKVTPPLPVREKSPIREMAHDEEASVATALKRNQAYYDKKVYDVRNRSLIYHSVMRWIDLSRVLCTDLNNSYLSAYFAFAKWKLKGSYKVCSDHSVISH